MRPSALAALALAGCGFRVSGQAAPGDGGDDARTDARSDGGTDAPTDAMIDAGLDAPMAVTTDHPSLADNGIASDLATSNFGLLGYAGVDGNPVRSMLVRFDLSTIPAGASITAVELHIWTDDDNGGLMSVYKVLESWSETTSTWNVRTTSTNWQGAGAEPPSRGTTVLGTFTPLMTFTEYTVPITPSVVSEWLGAPATNFGVVIRTTETNGARFATRDHGTIGRRPLLRITHAP